jgi:integrase
MSRQAKPWFRQSKNAWYVKFNGRHVSLGVFGKANENEAVKSWHHLFANGLPKPLTIVPASVQTEASVSEIITQFLADGKPRLRPESWRKYWHCLEPFGNAFRSRLASSLTIREVENYASRKQWSSSYRNGIIGAIVSAVRWAEREKLIAKNPLFGIRKPPKQSRGSQALIDAKTHEKLCRKASPTLRSFHCLLWLTGARPSEIANLRKADIDINEGIATLREHKTSHYGKQRFLFLPSDALAIIKRLRTENDKLFQHSAKAFGLRFWRLTRKEGVQASLYGYRHTFATDSLSKGIPDAHVSALLGHSSMAMLHKHYGHLTAYSQTLRNALASVR